MNKIDQFQEENHQSGFVALIGRPNVGKSTLLNKLVGEKIAITSPVAQTTRQRLRAILTDRQSQIIFVDTPGIHKPHHLLGERLVKSARSIIGEVDLILLIFDISSSPGRGDEYIVNLLKRHQIPVIVALNKVDLFSDEYLEKREKEYFNLISNPLWSLYSCSAIRGNGCKELTEKLTSLLPFGPPLYPKDMVSDQPEKVLISELIREQVLHHTREEIPHSVAVMIEKMETVNSKRLMNKKETTAILATIFVERKSQKGIIIGKGGSMLKSIGSEARMQIQELIKRRVYLELFVKVVPNWRTKPARLAELGYEEN
mgnify:CR=1 FL=1|tara:strand:+ start:907 stop:1851 length:945 start_codon:yes stop_codon:yes gene_type:complete